jgi:hypothetical protein
MSRFCAKFRQGQKCPCAKNFALFRQNQIIFIWETSENLDYFPNVQRNLHKIFPLSFIFRHHTQTNYFFHIIFKLSQNQGRSSSKLGMIRYNLEILRKREQNND